MQRLAFRPLPPEAMEKELVEEGFPASLVKPAVRLTPGLGPARELLQLNWFAEIRNAVLQLGRESSRGFAASVVAAQGYSGKGETAEHLDTLFDMFVLWSKDMIALQRNRRDTVLIIDQLEQYAKQAMSRPAHHWV
ncbi:hypothetical protein U6X42_12335, partial [Cutibacterium acnes]